MDILGEIFETLDLKGVLYFRTDFSGDWGVTVPDLEGAARFHLALQGRCRVDIDQGPSLDLGPGDLVLIPRGRSHVLADREGIGAPPLETVLDSAGYHGNQVLAVGDGDPNASTQLLCGHFSFRRFADHPILNALPDHILVTAAARLNQPWLDELLRLLARRALSETLGSEASVTRLSEIVLIEILRAGLAQSEEMRVLLDAFRDPQIGRAVELIHQSCNRPWSVDSLAREVGMSRSRFAERFRDRVGVGPVAYLSDWRLQKALSLLSRSQASIQQIAGETGYKSPAAFSRAFSGKFGLAPAEYRRAIV